MCHCRLLYREYHTLVQEYNGSQSCIDCHKQIVRGYLCPVCKMFSCSLCYSDFIQPDERRVFNIDKILFKANKIPSPSSNCFFKTPWIPVDDLCAYLYLRYSIELYKILPETENRIVLLEGDVYRIK